VSVIERVHTGQGNALELHDTQTTYQPTGEATVIRRTRGQGDDVVRWMQYDTLGRMVLNVEPNTSVGFTPIVGNTAGLLAWRYAYNDNGDLVGTSDARGCGANFAYDAGGRILAEDYSPCLASQPPYSAPNLMTGDGTEAFYWYDTPDPTVGSVPPEDPDPSGNVDVQGCFVQAALLPGRVASISDRASKTIMGYDGRGRTSCMAKKAAAPGTPSDTLASRYAKTWYAQTLTFDALDRPVTATTGAKVVLDPQNQSFVTTSYSRRGVVDKVTSGYGALVTSITRAADGPVNSITYGDLASTSTAFTYDVRRRVSTVQTMRGPPATWPTSSASESSVYQHTLEDALFHYDLVDNPTEIDDLRTASEWPAGAQPVTRTVTYDDLYRATAMGYSTGGAPDTWIDPFQAEDTAQTSDPRLAKPSPHVSFTNRVQSQTVAYDWLGNTAQSGDDVGGFYDRSLGTITNAGAGAGPYQLTTAAGGSSPRQGTLATTYDGAGNLAGMTVSRWGAPCVPANASCSARYVYDWDEVGRLVRARRWDGGEGLGTVSDPVPTFIPDVDLSYAYNASDDRTLKTAVDTSGNEVTTVYLYSALELRRAAWTGTDYDDSPETEVPYLFAHNVRLARVHYATVDPTLNASGTTHVLLELADHLGSTTIALDQATGELVERGTYEGFGAADSDYRPAGWGSFREDYRFTGKEEDVEVGLDYFGKRFYAPLLGRWISADPLAVHSPGKGDLNVYAYVHGRVLVAADPTGLDEQIPGGAAPGPTGGRIDETVTPADTPQDVANAAQEAKEAAAPLMQSPAAKTVAAYAQTAAVNVMAGACFVSLCSDRATAGFRVDGPPFKLTEFPLEPPPADSFAGRVDRRLAELHRQMPFGLPVLAMTPATLALPTELSEPAPPRRAESVSAYEVGTYDALRTRSVVGDKLDLHHAGQAHAMELTVPDYSRATGPAIALPEGEHGELPTLRGAVDMSPRSLLARDIWNLRLYTNTPNSSLLQLIELNKTMYPEAFAR
jgi:RHS repeat-associated protein